MGNVWHEQLRKMGSGLTAHIENLFDFWLQRSLGGFGFGHHQGQRTPPGPKGTYRGTYRSPTNTALTSAERIEHTTFCKEVVRSLPTEPTCVGRESF
jgi:hypothetical protein